ncbi:MAG: rod shape-determining protein MreC [Candidatus Moranbacteria bacterium]|nr:rod shape-determining protein MreC [Candidatus Moranbacteria bacterium]
MICFLAAYLNPKFFTEPIRRGLLTIAYPFQKTSFLLSRRLSNSAGFIKSIGNLREDNEKLIKENRILLAQLAELKTARSENDVLREQLKLAPFQRFDLEASFVIAKDNPPSESWILIDKGSARGIEKGMNVVVNSGILVGKIEEVSPASAKVIFLSNSSVAINALDIETGASGVVKGEYGLGLNMEMIPQRDLMNKGDAITTSGLGEEAPKGLLIGKVQEIKLSGDKLFQSAVIIPPVKYSDLEMVFVVKEKK